MVANPEQVDAWNGIEGQGWAADADRFDAAVVRHHTRLLEGASIARSEQVLDIGCGCGQSTLDAARAASAGSATGVDVSLPMLEVARARAERLGIA
ncbi:MAG TPA: class I SAM-dependent methyltransferase, partial [Acidimicrobiia bacterium]|nr:class I SAM-dependent methyltransferase [Acidimicrobiia bacterium]